MCERVREKEKNNISIKVSNGVGFRNRERERERAILLHFCLSYFSVVNDSAAASICVHQTHTLNKRARESAVMLNRSTHMLATTCIISSNNSSSYSSSIFLYPHLFSTNCTHACICCSMFISLHVNDVHTRYTHQIHTLNIKSNSEEKIALGSLSLDWL